MGSDLTNQDGRWWLGPGDGHRDRQRWVDFRNILEVQLTDRDGLDMGGGECMEVVRVNK